MPRHRLERAPRHRAQRPAGARGRRVQFRAVTVRPPGHRLPASGGGAANRLTALGTRLRPYRRRLLTGAVRGLLVSPWFAAGAGFVVATGAFLYAPHARLEFGSAIGVTQCKQVGCHPTTEQGGAPPIPAGEGAGLVTSSPSATRHAATAGLRFRYAVNWHTNGMFQMVLTVTGKNAVGNWRLAFVIPGATNVSVLGADWQQTATDGGTATGTVIGTSVEPAATYGTPDSAGPSPENDQASVASRPGAVYLIIDGDGTPAAPQNCVFDGAPCHFSPS